MNNGKKDNGASRSKMQERKNARTLELEKMWV